MWPAATPSFCAEHAYSSASKSCVQSKNTFIVSLSYKYTFIMTLNSLEFVDVYAASYTLFIALWYRLCTAFSDDLHFLYIYKFASFF